MSSKAKGTTTTTPKMGNNVADLSFTREGNDLVIRAKGLYETTGVETASGKDTRKLASSPGMWFWMPDGSKVAHPNAENRRLAIKFSAILGQPRDGTSEVKAKGNDAGRPMSQVSVG